MQYAIQKCDGIISTTRFHITVIRVKCLKCVVIHLDFECEVSKLYAAGMTAAMATIREKKIIYI